MSSPRWVVLAWLLAAGVMGGGVALVGSSGAQSVLLVGLVLTMGGFLAEFPVVNRLEKPHSDYLAVPIVLAVGIGLMASGNRFGQLTVLVGAVFTLVGVLMALRAYYRARQLAFLHARGVPARAEILSLRDTGGTVNNQPRVRLRLNITGGGVTAFEVTRTLTISRLSRPSVGDHLDLLLDPDDHRRWRIVPAAGRPPGAVAAGRPPLRALAAAGVVAALVTGGACAVILKGIRDDNAQAEKVVRAYLAALAAGDAKAALALGPAVPASPWLTDDVLKKQQAKAPITAVTVDHKTVFPDQTVLSMTYRFGTEQVSDRSYHVVQKDGRWQLRDTVVMITPRPQRAIPMITLYGRPVPSGLPIAVFPGPYDFGAPAAYTIGTREDWPTYPDATNGLKPFLDDDLSADGKQQTNAAMLSVLQKCASSTDLAPTGCPQRVDASGAVSAVWTLKAPAVPFRPQLADGGKGQVATTVIWTVVTRDAAGVTKSDEVRSRFVAVCDFASSPPAVTFVA